MAKEGGTGDLPHQVAFIERFSSPEQGKAIPKDCVLRVGLGAISSHSRNARARLWIADLKNERQASNRDRD